MNVSLLVFSEYRLSILSKYRESIDYSKSKNVQVFLCLGNEIFRVDLWVTKKKFHQKYFPHIFFLFYQPSWVCILFCLEIYYLHLVRLIFLLSAFYYHFSLVERKIFPSTFPSASVMFLFPLMQFEFKCLTTASWGGEGMSRNI